LLAVFDGHGEYGHEIAGFFRDNVARLVFAHAEFSAFSAAAAADNVAPPPVSLAEAEALAERATCQREKSSLLPPLAHPPGQPPPPPRRNVAAALRAALGELERALLSDASIDCSLSGTTGCVCVVVGDHVTVANVGDSRALLVRAAPAAARGAQGASTDEAAGAGPAAAAAAVVAPRLLPALLSVDHKPTMASETRRILLAGGRLKALTYEDGVDGPVRVYCAREELPGLAMSRSLCDATGKRAGVSSLPDLYSYTLARGDAFILLASDGLFEFVSSREVADTLAETGERAASDLARFLAAGGPEPQQHLQLALEALAELATQRWMEREGVCDDISIIVAEVAQA
jgi:serine/threonine protein phosphatase PrpC